MYGTSLNSVLRSPGRTKDFHSVHGNHTDRGSYPGSSATLRSEFPSTPCRGRLSCPRAIIVNSYEISGHSEQTSPAGTLFPNIHAYHLLGQWLKIFAEPEITEAPEKLEVLDPAEVSLCVQTSYKCTQFLCQKAQNSCKICIDSNPHPSNHQLFLLKCCNTNRHLQFLSNYLLSYQCISCLERILYLRMLINKWIQKITTWKHLHGYEKRDSKAKA